ncbi:uncharacterized protein UV8b_00081 [Ustilaginoidea virens]|uniref:Arylsulfotransferase n=1 Tax=Ustilaginoidea virens TaxID=1159556 RepID=A0A8E5HID6_USTVR|nr:uncharacterized protein UV8b_00081 [Ustilaginoidea virens]QUC15840.1 hypothetical protein UV8b_00081 [Ustilaginoidea virens]
MRFSSFTRGHRGSGIGGTAATILGILELLISLHAEEATAEQPAPASSQAYDLGHLGRYPVQHFKSFEHIAPRPNMIRQDDRCSRSLLTFLSPHGSAEQAIQPQATILDHNGRLIWTSGWDKKQIYNLMAQEYKGRKYITFWAGKTVVGGHGAGSYYMLDETYNMTRRIQAKNGLKGDFHEFRITPEGTALITVYDVQEADLSGFGKERGPIRDSVFQEIDIETGQLVFEWRASKHVSIADTHRDIGEEGEPNGKPFDWFHISSVDKDAQGNYLISSAHLHSIFCISGQNGEVIWTLGGKGNNFKDLSGGKATNFAFQHDARWDNNYSELTLFDNSREAHPRGVRLRVDTDVMGVELITEYASPTHAPAASPGSLQNLPNGNVLVGYGSSGSFAEFTRDGKVLCETHFGPQSRSGTSAIRSYRVLKFAWHSAPETQPDLTTSQDDASVWRAYASWHGSTEVSDWVLQGSSDPAVGKWKTLASKAKDGFEADFLLEADHSKYIRVVAMDSRGNALSTSEPAETRMDIQMHKVDGSRAAFEYRNARARAWLAGLATGWGIATLALVFRHALEAWFTRRRRMVGHAVAKGEKEDARGPDAPPLPC